MSIKRTHFVQQLEANPYLVFSSHPAKCSVSVVSEPAHLELTNNDKPFPAEVSRTSMELSSVATLSTTTQEGWPLGIGVRFAVDSHGNPLLCLNDSIRKFFTHTQFSLHVQLEQCGLQTPQCSVLGNLDKPGDKMTSKKLHSIWKKKFGEEVDEDLIYIVSVERVLHMEDFGEVCWALTCEKLVDEINTHNGEDIYRFCNIYADLEFQVPFPIVGIREVKKVGNFTRYLSSPDGVLDAKMVWVDQLGFDIRVKSTQNDVFEVRIPFPREVTDEKGAKSSFNCMSQLAWEMEKNFHVPDFKKGATFTDLYRSELKRHSLVELVRGMRETFLF